MSACGGKASPALSSTQHPCMELCDLLLRCWRLWDQGIKSIPWKTTACKWVLCSAQHLYFCSHLLCPRGRRDSHEEKPCVMCYLHLALPMMALVCLHPLFFSCIVGVLEKTIWVSWVSLGVTEGRRTLGKGGMADVTRGAGQHHPPGQPGATALGDAALVLPSPACLVLLLSSPGSAGSRHWSSLGQCLAGSGQVRGALQKIGRRGDIADLRKKKKIKVGFISRT